MKFHSIFITCLLVIFAYSHHISRRKRSAWDMADGWYDLRSSVAPNFECQDNGYFADVDNGCQIFHVCQFVQLPYSKPRFLHYTFFCGNGTIFNQLTQTCTTENQLSIPCQNSPKLYYMNKRVGELNQWFHSPDDFEKIKLVNNDNRFNAVLEGAQNPFRPTTPTNAIDSLEDDEEDDFR